MPKSPQTLNVTHGTEYRLKSQNQIAMVEVSQSKVETKTSKAAPETVGLTRNDHAAHVCPCPLQQPFH